MIYPKLQKAAPTSEENMQGPLKKKKKKSHKQHWYLCNHRPLHSYYNEEIVIQGDKVCEAVPGQHESLVRLMMNIIIVLDFYLC